MNKRNSSLQPIGRSLLDYHAIQKNPKDYYSDGYLAPKRLSSYGYQYNLALQTKCTTFLNVGSANNLLRLMLNSQNLEVVESDIDINTKPSIIAVLPDLPYRSKSFEVVLCFQVLEHLPIELFQPCIKEMTRVAQKYLIISLPDQTISNKQKAKNYFYRVFKHPREWKNYRSVKLDSEHFWEIGQSTVSLDMIVSFFTEENLGIVNHFRNPLFSYHHFFLLQIKP